MAARRGSHRFSSMIGRLSSIFVLIRATAGHFSRQVGGKPLRGANTTVPPAESTNQPMAGKPGAGWPEASLPEIQSVESPSMLPQRIHVSCTHWSIIRRGTVSTDPAMEAGLGERSTRMRFVRVGIGAKSVYHPTTRTSYTASGNARL